MLACPILLVHLYILVGMALVGMALDDLLALELLLALDLLLAWYDFEFWLHPNFLGISDYV